MKLTNEDNMRVLKGMASTFDDVNGDMDDYIKMLEEEFVKAKSEGIKKAWSPQARAAALLARKKAYELSAKADEHSKRAGDFDKEHNTQEPDYTREGNMKPERIESKAHHWVAAEHHANAANEHHKAFMEARDNGDEKTSREHWNKFDEHRKMALEHHSKAGLLTHDTEMIGKDNKRKVVGAVNPEEREAVNSKIKELGGKLRLPKLRG